MAGLGVLVDKVRHLTAFEPLRIHVNALYAHRAVLHLHPVRDTVLFSTVHFQNLKAPIVEHASRLLPSNCNLHKALSYSVLGQDNLV